MLQRGFTTCGTGIGFVVTTGVGCVVGETPVCPEAVFASNGTHGIALRGGRTPNPPPNPDPDAFPPPEPDTPLGVDVPPDCTDPDVHDAPPVAHNKPQCQHFTLYMTPLYFGLDPYWPDF